MELIRPILCVRRKGPEKHRFFLPQPTCNHQHPPPMPELWATTWPLYVQYRVNSGFLVSVKLPRPPLPPQKQNDLDDPKQNPDLLQVLILFFTSERDLTEKVSQATISLFRHYRTTGIKHDVQVMSIQIFRGCTF